MTERLRVFSQGPFAVGEIFPDVGTSPRVEKVVGALVAAGVMATAEPVTTHINYEFSIGWSHGGGADCGQ